VDLSTPIAYLKGVGPQRAAQLETKGIQTAADLLFYAPFRYEDRSNVKPIARLAPGEMATVLAEVRSVRMPQFQRRDLGMFEATFGDNGPAPLLAKWFHAKYLRNVLTPGVKVALFGKVELDSFRGELTMLHPEFEILRDEEGEESDAALHTGRIVPIYEGAGKITTRLFRVMVRHLLDSLAPLNDELPEAIRLRWKMPDLMTSLQELHFPSASEEVRLLNAFRSPAQFRMIFEEFFWLEAGMAMKRGKARLETGIVFELNARVREKIKAILPFRPTAAQKRVLGEIARDMAGPAPMSRLLQGDVGSGKTIVAAEAAVIAVENGYQAALLAPTEILATQHYLSLKNIFAPINYPVALLVGSQSKGEKEGIKKVVAAGLVPVAVGTHALLEEDVQFNRLGLAIIDEQHRFGVLQRQKLARKGVTPDVLVMTATPIPRTLALTIYGDLDTSVIDELPPGRKPIQTLQKTLLEIEQVWSFVKREVDNGRQAYVVYPLIEESETKSMKAAQEAYDELSRVVFPTLRVGLLHGKLPASEKERVMDDFKKGELQILVATTVIEVGVDVPNASVMVIEHAEGFGLAQIHQLRGRVGRGAAQSYCILVTGRTGDAAKERIRTLLESSDGFHIAEMDLKLRGPGEFLGTRQSGLPAFRIGNILRDEEILEIARREAIQFVEAPPSPEALAAARAYIKDHWQRRYGLALVG
jgi:ATP-dependent DNA helicase RecG